MKKLLLGAAVSSIALGMSQANADPLAEALTSGKVSGDIRIRYESVEQDNAPDDASALTMRSRIGYTTGTVSGLSAKAEFEDVRVIGGMDDYTVGPTGFNVGEYSVIADPEVTELDQGYLQYKGDMFTVKVGRQVITYDNHRFVGDVGWRQDRQSFDGVAINVTPSEALSLSYNFIDERERIFAEAADVDSTDHLLNASYKLPLGKVSGYVYMLEDDNTEATLDTYGVRFAGSKDSFSYAAEFATQTADSGGPEADADYLLAELGYNFDVVTVKGTYEVLGSDEGGYGFSTPLATLHKFNGWADVFLGTPAVGLQDFALSVSGKVGGGSWSVIYHDFSADESTGGVDDLGDELDLVYSRKFGKIYNTGIKGAFYSAGDTGTDTDKIWLWVGASF